MKQGNNNNSCSTCNCEYLQLHLLCSPKSLFSERFNVHVMSIILFIALVASFSLKYLPISEIKFVPLLMGIEVFVICLLLTTNLQKFCHIGKLLYPFVLGIYVTFVNLRNLNNYILKCFFLIDLKTSQIVHQDVGQMDMYVRMYDKTQRTEGDNPTIGLLLCSETSEDMARYSVLNGNEQIFQAKYLTYLPTKEQLIKEIEQQKLIFELQKQEG